MSGINDAYLSRDALLFHHMMVSSWSVADKLSVLTKLTLVDLSQEEVRGSCTFLRANPEWRLVTIDANTPLPAVLDYLASHSKIPNLTDQLSEASTRTLSVAARTGLSDIYCLVLSDGIEVAVKCLRQHDPKHVKRTTRELNVWSKLKHKNVLGLSGMAIFQGCLAMVSPWMAYGSVNSVLRKWPEMNRIPWCLQLARAIEYVHGENVVHGDVKGDNLVMDQDGTIKLTDFGLSIMDEAVLQFSQTDPGGGTTRWMRSRETDIYAMGMTILEIITGDVPFREIQSGHSVMWAVRQERRTPRVSELELETASGRDMLLLTVMKWCWKYDPAERPTARQVVQMLEVLVED
ncbi:Tyrosine kinase specific for activated [Ceratobasidium sp. AG-Ba]|nr:Tyrosine kinase specific for activated [Ceratobasidium sp. AG-Ba]